MGNNACCAGPEVMKHVDSTNEQTGMIKPQPQPYHGKVSEEIRRRLDQIRPFHDKLSILSPIVHYGQDIYNGPLNQDKKAQGMGKMYKSNGQLFVGNFYDGKANGQGYYFLPNGTYYHGNLKDNKANDQSGKLVLSDNTVLQGCFLDNVINGKGTESGRDYKYDGQFKQGKRTRGKLTWQKQGQQFQYQGQFNENNLFTNYGLLKEPTGKYEGQFKNGKKNGKGVYEYENKLKYQGTYVDGVKQGEGTIYNKDGSVGYSGQWKNGMPHGKGTINNSFGNTKQGIFDQGIQARYLPDEQTHH